MSNSQFPLSDDTGEQDVWLMARRAALMYYHMAKAIVDRLGETEGRELIRKAIWDYGVDCGQRVREGAKTLGLSTTEAKNYGAVPDLPSKGWHSEEVTNPSGEKRRGVTFCPLAATWKELETDHPGAESLGRIYCVVDEAKYHAFNCGLRCWHSNNVLDGDSCCIIEVENKERGR